MSSQGIPEELPTLCAWATNESGKVCWLSLELLGRYFNSALRMARHPEGFAVPGVCVAVGEGRGWMGAKEENAGLVQGDLCLRSGSREADLQIQG